MALGNFRGDWVALGRHSGGFGETLGGFGEAWGKLWGGGREGEGNIEKKREKDRERKRKRENKTLLPASFSSSPIYTYVYQ